MTTLDQIQQPRTPVTQTTAVEQARAVAEVAAAVRVAQDNPRNRDRALGEMRDSCGRLALANRAFYSVPNRGNGPSVHLARELARIWGNVRYGVHELSRNDETGMSEIRAFAVDLETNVESTRTFQGRQALDDVLRGIRDRYYLSLDHLRFLGEEVGDARTSLVLTPLHFATQYDYEWLAWEQVPTVLPVWEACADVLRDLGWNVWTGLLYAEQYGVPQTRKRAFLLASRRREVAPPAPTHSRYYSRNPSKLDPGVAKWVSMAEALRGANDGWVLRNNSSANAAERTPNEPAPTLYFGQRSNYCAWEWRGEGPSPELPEWAFNRPSTTIVGSFKPEIVAAPGYRTTVSRQNAPDSVRVTIAEAGVLQSFPADHPWQGAKGKQFLQAGNAVPPGLALHALAAAAGIDAREVAA